MGFVEGRGLNMNITSCSTSLEAPSLSFSMSTVIPIYFDRGNYTSVRVGKDRRKKYSQTNLRDAPIKPGQDFFLSQTSPREAQFPRVLWDYSPQNSCFCGVTGHGEDFPCAIPTDRLCELRFRWNQHPPARCSFLHLAK